MHDILLITYIFKDDNLIWLTSYNNLFILNTNDKTVLSYKNYITCHLHIYYSNYILLHVLQITCLITFMLSVTTGFMSNREDVYEG